MDRALVWTAAGLAAGIAAAAAGAPWLLALLFTAGAASALALRYHLPYRQHAAALVLFAAAGGALHAVRGPEGTSDPLSRFSRSQDPGTLQLEGIVRQAPLFLPDRGYTKFLLDVEQVVDREGQVRKLSGRVLVRWTEPRQRVHSGERVRVKGKLGHRLGPVNHGFRGIEDYYRAQAVHSDIRIRGAAISTVAVPRFSVIYWASRLRAAEAEILQRAVPADVLRFVLTIWLGERGLIHPEENEAYIAAGTAHILSVSGVHVGIIYMSAQLLLSGVIRDRRKRAAVIVLLVIAFALAAGARVATLRCALMVFLYLAAELLRREPDPPTALGLAAIVLLLVNPHSLFDAGFLLSFGSVASLLLFTPAFEHMLQAAPAALARTAAPTLAVQILPLPLALHFFHILPLLAPLVNLIVIPVISVVLWLTFFTVLAGVVSAPLSALFGHALAPLVWINDWLARSAAHLPGSHLVLTSPTWAATLAYYAAALALFLLCVQSGGRKRAAEALALCTALCIVLWRPWFPEPRVDFLDVGHGDSTFVRTPSGATMLVDAGDGSEYSNLGAQVVVPFLLSQGVSKLDVLVVSHADRDHIGGVPEVLRRIRVGEVVLGTPSDSELEQDLLAQCERLDVPVRRVHRGDAFHLPGGAVEVLHPPPGWAPELGENEHSVVLRVRWPGMDLLLTGDVQQKAEALLTGTDCDATLLKVPHHGSDTSSTEAFIDAVSPAVAVISVVPRGNYRTANRLVIDRYLAADSRVYRTDHYGGIQVTPTDEGLEIASARARRGLFVP